jgi:hypothetical protein
MAAHIRRRGHCSLSRVGSGDGSTDHTCSEKDRETHVEVVECLYSRVLVIKRADRKV